MEVKQELNNLPNKFKIQIENIEVSHTICSCSVKTEIKEELLESDSLNNDTNRYFDHGNSLHQASKEANIENIKLEEEDKPDLVHIENGFSQEEHEIEIVKTLPDQSCYKEPITHQVEEKTLKCEICLKQFTHELSLKKHLRTHTRQKPYQCEICDKQFSHPSDLKRHGRTHTGEKPYQCEICDKQFTRKDHLSGHMRIHTGEKPHQCEFCLKQFAHASDLKKHFSIHSGERNREKRFHCEICVKQFARSRDLKRHSRTHTGEKPY
ncbi:unnamed protein product [Diabrotica balteata]|uniref:C2H2-type domain-containing protein n=1 Tax=Diabrotica balteata TaxID=107213 RepID=A0A9N9SR96_DIABA|nr:unnamed protein product [Diabrotica balteata]